MAKKKAKKNGETGMPQPKLIDEKDALEFARYDSDMRYLMSQLENIKLRKDMENLKAQNAQLEAQVRNYKLDGMQKEISSQIETTNQKYQAVLKTIAGKHGIKDTKNMTIDPDVMTVRELGVDIPLPQGE
jgi:septation ring formation regulator EzrA